MKGRVLIVDDDLALSEMLSIVLRQEGLDVTHVADGTSAVAAFRDSRPDLVLLDVMLPGMDGMEVCRRIRAESGVPIVMLTARTDTVDIVVGLESGGGRLRRPSPSSRRSSSRTSGPGCVGAWAPSRSAWISATCRSTSLDTRSNVRVGHCR